MSSGAARGPAIRRLRAVHRKMSFAAFESLPHRLGWKHEYYGGKAHIRPAYMSVTFVLNLTPRTGRRQAGMRPVTPDDARALVKPFLAAFAQAPEYVGYSAREFRKKAIDYLAGFFGEVRGEWSPASVVAEVGGEILGAALVKRREQGPLLDCLFVHPWHGRQGWATALVTRAVQTLLAEGVSKLQSSVHLANEASLAWHQRFGFREVPDGWIASYRARFFAHELERRKDLSEAERALLEKVADYWWAEAHRLEELRHQEYASAYPKAE
jgi:RimJ/RimL family protein N-acetyltransferase